MASVFVFHLASCGYRSPVFVADNSSVDKFNADTSDGDKFNADKTGWRCEED